ncbi:probable galacturonosyltransferase 7 isoform X3 [Daucus carota subsp. sativus]|uniref:probable galacturonosyltransferase 7 isoform X3 n=1 Tax=Daucus carota subsp. sativus TaxID=79200 RepID=UPI0007EFD153|nr:PREDICTED: probable galacturonosyltransferase 7 isoform X3 [Daucus carota subsp. sativus]
MKGGGGGASSYTLPRRWRGPVIAVLALVFLSMLVPLVFMLGLFKSFHSSVFDSDSRPLESRLRVYDQHVEVTTKNYSQQAETKYVDQQVRVTVPTLPKDFTSNPGKEVENKTNSFTVLTNTSYSRPETNILRQSGRNEVAKNSEGTTESEQLCALKYGSYCLWRIEHKEKVKDLVVKRMKDQLYVARAYYPSIAKLPALDKLSLEMKQNIQEYERVLSETSTDVDLPSHMKKKLQNMDDVIARAKSYPVDCNNVDKKFRQLVDLTEDEANFHAKQSAFLYQLAVLTMPKSLHCLSMRLTVEYFKSPSLYMEQSLSEKYMNPDLQHYVIFSNNILASSVVVNSTVMHAKESGNQVFHVLTDKQNYFAMKVWFFSNTFREATVQVLNIEDLEINTQEKGSLLQLSLPEEFRISFHDASKPSKSQIVTDYMSLFSNSHYVLPKIFHTLKKVVVLDDDLVVQRDLSALWSLDMDGKVISALQFCSLRLGQINYNFGKNFDGNTCAWLSGFNVIDLVRWRDQAVTETYKRLVQELDRDRGRFKTATVFSSLLTFQGMVHTLDDDWVLPGLGHTYSLAPETVRNAAVLHFNGNRKPWLELGIQKYKTFWRTYLNREHRFLSDCNVNP